MPIVGILLIVSLGILASLRLLFRLRAFQRIKQYGVLIEAKVTAVKREERLVTQLGGAHSTSQRLTYENVLYAQGHDPLTQQDYSFRIEVPDFSQFQVGESLPIRLNRENPNEYRIDYSKSSKRSKRAEPHSDYAYHDYQQGYRSIEKEGAQNTLPKREDETPEMTYPQRELLNQQEIEES